MTKITNDGLTRSGTGCFIALPIWQQWASKGLVVVDDVTTSTACLCFTHARAVLARRQTEVVQHNSRQTVHHGLKSLTHSILRPSISRASSLI